MDKMTFYFSATIEGDLMICASIAKIIKQTSDDKTVLIFPSHNRLANDKLKDYYVYFDEVIKLPYCKFPAPKFIVRELKNSWNFKKQLSKIKFEENSKFLMFDVFTLTDLIIFNHIKKQKTIKIGFISAFVGEQFNRKKLEIVWFTTLIQIFFGILFAGSKILINTKRKTIDSKLTAYRYKLLLSSVDFILHIENALSIPKSKNHFFHLPYPVEVLKEKEDLVNTESYGVLFLVSTNHAKRFPGYWDYVNKLLSIINSYDTDKKIVIYIKDHPVVKSEAADYLSGDNLFYLNNKFNTEKLLIDNQYNINILVGYSSTALITASWLGYATYDYTFNVGYPEGLEDYYKDYLSLSSLIKPIESLKNDLRKEIQKNKVNIEEIYRLWQETIIKDKEI